MVSVLAKALPLCLAVFWALVALNNADGQTNPICTNITANGTIKIIGTFTDNKGDNNSILYILDKNSFLYEVPESAFDNTFGEMDLRNLTAKPIEEKWTAFNNSDFKKLMAEDNLMIFGLQYNCMVKCKLYVYFVPANKMNTSMVFNEAGNTLETVDLKLDIMDNVTLQFLYVKERDQIMAFGTNTDGQFVLQEYQLMLNDSWIEKSNLIGVNHFIYKEGDSKPVNILILNGKYNNSESPVKEWKNVTTFEKWNIMGGFQFKDFFHIITDNKVYLIPNMTLESDILFNQSFVYLHGEMLSNDVEKYFVCTGNDEIPTSPYPSLNPTNSTESVENNPPGWILIVVVVVIVACLIACVVYCVNKDDNDMSQPPPPKARNQTKEKSKPQPQAKSSTGSAGKSSISKSKSNSKGGGSNTGPEQSNSNAAPHSSSTN